MSMLPTRGAGARHDIAKAPPKHIEMLGSASEQLFLERAPEGAAALHDYSIRLMRIKHVLA